MGQSRRHRHRARLRSVSVKKANTYPHSRAIAAPAPIPATRARGKRQEKGTIPCIGRSKLTGREELSIRASLYENRLTRARPCLNPPGGSVCKIDACGRGANAPMSEDFPEKTDGSSGGWMRSSSLVRPGIHCIIWPFSVSFLFYASPLPHSSISSEKNLPFANTAQSPFCDSDKSLMLGDLAGSGWRDCCGKFGKNADTEKKAKREDADGMDRGERRGPCDPSGGVWS